MAVLAVNSKWNGICNAIDRNAVPAERLQALLVYTVGVALTPSNLIWGFSIWFNLSSYCGTSWTKDIIWHDRCKVCSLLLRIGFDILPVSLERPEQIDSFETLAGALPLTISLPQGHVDGKKYPNPANALISATLRRPPESPSCMQIELEFNWKLPYRNAVLHYLSRVTALQALYVERIGVSDIPMELWDLVCNHGSGELSTEGMHNAVLVILLK